MNYFTTIPASDGLGARFHRSLLLLYFYFYKKETNPVEFLYSPLEFEGFGRNFYGYPTKIQCYYHTAEIYKQRAKEWDDRLEYNGKKITDVDLNLVKVEDNYLLDALINALDIFDDRLFLCANFWANTPTINNIERIPHIFTKYKNDVISKFDMKNTLSKDKINIALHIRRDDAINFPQRWVSDEYYLNIIDIIEKNLFKDYNLTIYTQKNNFNFNKFEKYNVIYDEITEDYDTFVDMVFSDILIMGRSSFSYSAALLNKNMVLYPKNFYCKNVGNWVEIEDFVESIKKLNLKS